MCNYNYDKKANIIKVKLELNPTFKVGFPILKTKKTPIVTCLVTGTNISPQVKGLVTMKTMKGLIVMYPLTVWFLL